jgi:hypothetical protein
MTEPKTIRETAILLAGVDARLGLVQKMVWGLFALLGTLLAGAAALYVQIGDLKTEVAVVRATTQAIDTRSLKFEKTLEDIRAEQSRTRESLSRIEARFAAGATDPKRGTAGAATTDR